MNKRQAAAEQICSTLRRRGFRALLAGGCVRDMLLKTPPRDFDIATNARPFEVAQLFERTIDIGAAFGVQVVLLPEGPFEVATFRKDGPYHDGRHPCSVAFTGEEEDARRRDFTINALFYDPVDRKVLDYVGGLDDLRTGLVRAVGVPRERFEEDHLRLLRAIRFAARLGYAIERETYQAIRESAPRITSTSAERIRDELLKMLTEGGTRRAFEMLDDTGLLHQILPEVSAMKGVAQPPEFHPEGDVFTHTLLMLDLLNHPSAALALGVLLHDAGKPATQTRTDRIRFNDHDKAGAVIAREVCERLRLPRRDTESSRSTCGSSTSPNCGKASASGQSGRTGSRNSRHCAASIAWPAMATWIRSCGWRITRPNCPRSRCDPSPWYKGTTSSRSAILPGPCSRKS